MDRLEHREGEARARAGPGPHPEDGPLGHVGVGQVGGEEDHLGPGFDLTRPGPALDVPRHEALENRERVHAPNLGAMICLVESFAQRCKKKRNRNRPLKTCDQNL